MHLARPCILLTVVALLAGASAHAAEIVRDPELIETVPIQGATLAMTPKDAFDHLTALGYRAGSIATYQDWNTGGLNLVRGDYGAPGGRSEISLSRAKSGERIVNLSETLNRPQAKLNTQAEIRAVRDHFGIPADDPNCHVNEHNTGTCRVADAAENANHAFGISAFPSMILRYATRNKELKDTY